MAQDFFSGVNESRLFPTLSNILERRRQRDLTNKLIGGNLNDVNNVGSYLGEGGDPGTLSTLLALQKMNEGTFTTVSPGSTYGSTKDGVFTQQGVANPRPTETDWQDETDANGNPVYMKIPGTNATRVRQFKYQTSPLTGKLEKATRLSSAGTEPISSSQVEDAKKYTIPQEVIDAIGRNEVPLDKAVVGTRGMAGTIIRNEAIKQVKQQYPDYAYYTSNNIGSMQKDYQPGGRVGQKAVQLNTAILHSGKLIEAATALNNGDVPLFNKIANSAREHFGGEKLAPLQRLKAAIDAYSGELGSLFKSGNASATEFDVQNMMSSLRQQDSPEVIKQTVSELAGLGADKVAELDKGYFNLMNKLYNGKGLLGEEQKNLLRRLGISINDVYGKSSQSGQYAPNKKVPSDEDINKMTPEQLQEYLKQ